MTGDHHDRGEEVPTLSEGLLVWLSYAMQKHVFHSCLSDMLHMSAAMLVSIARGVAMESRSSHISDNGCNYIFIIPPTHEHVLAELD